MSGSDAMHSEMPGFSPGRPGGEREPLLDMIFDRRPLPPGAPPEMHDLARMLAIAAGPAEPGEMAGEATALAAFARLASPANVSPAASRPARHRLTRRPAHARLPLAAALVTAAAGLGSMTAAYVGVLPTPIQHLAHVAMGAPAPDHDDVRGPSGLSSTHSRVMTPRPAASTTPAIPFSGPNQRARPCKPRSARRVPASSTARRPHLHAPGRAGPEPGHAEPGPDPGPAESGQECGHAEPEPHQEGGHAWSEPERGTSGGSAGLPQASASAGCQASATEIVIPPNP